MKKLILLFSILLYPLTLVNLNAQEHDHEPGVHGRVVQLGADGEKIPLEFVNVYWLGATRGTITGKDGHFHLPGRRESEAKLVVSYIGFENDTIAVPGGTDHFEILLEKAREIEEVVVAKRLGGTMISRIQPMQISTITEKGLQKLACCNLSESFENSATVDVGFSDAVTGSKKIQMLGLDGVYSQMMFENIPILRGLEAAYGLSHIPGTWMESIQVSKGTASVMNGYESTTGQINLEYRKPQDSEPLYVNLYGNSKGRLEANFHSAVPVGEKLATMLLGHISMTGTKHDKNQDGFLDIPLSQQINLFNRWKYTGERSSAQFGLSYLDETRDGGQVDYDHDEDIRTNGLYGTSIHSRRYHAYGKYGISYPSKPYQSIGFIGSFTRHEQDSYFGNNDYTGEQTSGYFNMIYQGILGTTAHKINGGFSFTYDHIMESYDSLSFDRQEYVPGIFGQYTYSDLENWTVIVGIRLDYNSHHGLLYTPRLHSKYDFDENTILRATLGKAYRSPNIFSENQRYLVSSRNMIIQEEPEIEEAWNMGLNLTRHFPLAGQREAVFSVDFYRTRFVKQLIVDADQSARAVYFYNLDGTSYSNALQADFLVQPLNGLEINLAYRLNDVHATYNGALKEVPLVGRHKGLFSLGYATRFEIWQVDFTGQWTGSAHLPNTGDNPPEYQRGKRSPDFFMIHAQLTRRFKHFDVYAGGENLLDFRQEDPIVAADDPFGEYFDASMIWGPLSGRMFYAGLRISIE